MATKKSTELDLSNTTVNGQKSLLETVRAELEGLESQRDSLQASLHQTLGAIAYAKATLSRLEKEENKTSD